MNETEAELYAEICEFKLDDPTAPYPMSAKLAWEYHWSEIYTLRAMYEYKKYIFLAAIAEGMVSPSSAVDGVWHYHLLYTHSYWEELCGKIFKKKSLQSRCTPTGSRLSVRFKGYLRRVNGVR